MKKAGVIVKSSLLAARELYEWLVHWDKIVQHNQMDTDYQFVCLTPTPPDSNIVIFAVKKKSSTSLKKMNKLTQLVYKRFTIQTELGERDYSYSQPFFISKTQFRQPRYPFATLKPVFERYFGNTQRVGKEYQEEGVVVLRATVMNPYIWPARRMGQHLYIQEFVQELDRAARESVKLIS